jgi:hypothetical protein
MKRGRPVPPPYSVRDRNWGEVFQLTPMRTYKARPAHDPGKTLLLEMFVDWPSWEIQDTERFQEDIAFLWEEDPVNFFPKGCSLVVIEVRYSPKALESAHTLDTTQHFVCFSVKTLLTRSGHALMFMPEPTLEPEEEDNGGWGKVDLHKIPCKRKETTGGWGGGGAGWGHGQAGHGHGGAAANTGSSNTSPPPEGTGPEGAAQGGSSAPKEEGA